MELFLLLNIVFASLNSVLLHKIPKNKSIISFNMLCSFVWVISLLCLNKFSLHINSETIFWGVLYGIIQMLFLVFKTKAMNSGPVSVTTLIGNCSMVLSTAVSIYLWHEAISLWQIVGIVVLIFSVVLCTYTKSSNSSAKGWILYCGLFFVFAAGVGITFKLYSKTQSVSSTNDMMIVASIVMLLILFVAKLFNRTRSGNKEEFADKKYILIAILCGVLSCVYNRLNITLSGQIPGAVFYPSFNGGVCLLSLILSLVFLKERLNKKQVVGLFMGIMAVVIIGIF